MGGVVGYFVGLGLGLVVLDPCSAGVVGGLVAEVAQGLEFLVVFALHGRVFGVLGLAVKLAGLLLRLDRCLLYTSPSPRDS